MGGMTKHMFTHDVAPRCRDYRRLEAEFEVKPRTPTRNRGRFRVRVVLAGEAKLRGRARYEPAIASAKLGQMFLPPVGRRWPCGVPIVSRGVPWCPVVSRGAGVSRAMLYAMLW